MDGPPRNNAGNDGIAATAGARRPGAAFVAFLRDVQGAATEATAPPLCSIPRLGAAPADLIVKAAKKIGEARRPVILLGLGASGPKATDDKIKSAEG